MMLRILFAPASNMADELEREIRARAPDVSEAFLPELLATLRQNDICVSMLLANEITEQDLKDIGE